MIAVDANVTLPPDVEGRVGPFMPLPMRSHTRSMQSMVLEFMDVHDLYFPGSFDEGNADINSSWTRQNKSKTSTSLIDYIFVSRSLNAKSFILSLAKPLCSDHRPAVCDIVVSPLGALAAGSLEADGDGR